MTSGEGDILSDRTDRSPGLIPVLAFSGVLILAVVVVIALRYIIPAAPLPTPSPDIGPSVLPSLIETPSPLILAAQPTSFPTQPPGPGLVPSPTASATWPSSPTTIVPTRPAATPTVTVPSSTSTPLPTATPPPTVVIDTASTPALPPVALGLPSIIYAFYDWQNTNFSTAYPTAGPIGSVAVFTWDKLHIGPNQFDWSALDAYLSKAAGMTVTLADGTVISKPIILEIVENLSEQPSKQIAHTAVTDTYSARFVYHDYTPDFVRRQITATLSHPITYTLPDGRVGTLTDDSGSYLVEVGPSATCAQRTVAIVPKYDHPTWQEHYKQFIAALGQRYDKHPQIVAVIFGPGIDQEYGQATKDDQGCPLRSEAYKVMSEKAYLDAVIKDGPANDLADAWRAAFPSKPLFFQFTSVGKDRVEQLVAAGHVPPIGLKQATLTYDSANHWQSNGRGVWQLMNTYSTTVPLAWENAYPNVGSGPAALQNRYFTVLAGLSTFPAFMDFNGWIAELSKDAPWLLDFTRTYLGRSITTTNEVWVAMRGTQYLTPTVGAVSYAGWPGDASYGLYRLGQAPLLRRDDLAKEAFPAATLDHPYALMARSTDIAKGIPALAFAVDRRWPFWKQKPHSVDPAGVWYEVTIKYLDQGNDTFSLVYQDMSGLLKRQTVTKKNSNIWVTTTLTITDAYLAGGLGGGADIMLDAESGDEIVHMVAIKGRAVTPSPTIYLTPVAVDRSSWIVQQSQARATATALASLPGVVPTPTINRGLWLPVTTPTAAPGVEGRIAPPGRPTIVPIIYAFYDWRNTDFAKQYPEFPAIGSQPVFTWAELHKGPNQYNWAPIDDYLRNAAAMTVTLLNGTVISKPIILEILENVTEVYSTQYEHDPNYANRVDPWAARIVFHDYSPDFVRNAIAAPLTTPITYATTSGQIRTLTNDGGSYLVDVTPGMGSCITRTVGIVPKYNNPTWLMYYKQFLQALGARYGNHPQIVAFVIGPGIDQEYGQATKDFFECAVRSRTDAYMPYNNYLDVVVKAGITGDILDTVRSAFPNKPVMLQATGSGKDRVEIAMQKGYAYPVGIKQASLTYDNQNQYQTNNVGTLQLMDRYSQTTYIGWENAYAYTGPNPQGLQIRYFTLLAGLMSFPDYMDFMGNWMIDYDLLDAGLLHWTSSYLGRTITNTEDVWVALRDTDYWPPTGGAIKYGGWHDDFTYGLHRRGEEAGINNPVIKKTQMAASPYSLPTETLGHIYSFIARRTDNASGNSRMFFYVDPRWGYYNQPTKAQNPASGAWYDLSVKYVDLGTDTLSLSYMSFDGVTKTRTIIKTNTRTWITTTFVLTDAVWVHGLARNADVILSSDPQNGGLDEIVHMVQIKGHRGGEPTPTPSVSPTPKPTRTPTRTPIPTSPTPTRTPTPTGSVTPAATPTPFQELRVNAGGPVYVDSAGHTWQADQAYIPGSWGFYISDIGGAYTSPITVTGTADPLLYQSERYFGRQPGAYILDIPNGQYEVELRFAEIFGREPSKRVFNVELEGSLVLENFDIAATVGLNTALNRTYTVTVSDNQLTINFIPITDSAKINAFRVTRLGAAVPSPTATATPGGAIATPTPTRTATTSPMVTATLTPTATRTAMPAMSPTTTRTPSPTATATPDLSLEGRINAIEQRYQRLLDLVHRLLEILKLFGSIQ